MFSGGRERVHCEQMGQYEIRKRSLKENLRETVFMMARKFKNICYSISPISSKLVKWIPCRKLAHRHLLVLFYKKHTSCRSSQRRCSVKKKVFLKIQQNFTSKHLCWRSFLIKLLVFRTTTSLKRASNTGVSL